MASYDITSPDGGKWRVTAPDDASEADVLAYAKNQFASQKQAEPERSAGEQIARTPGLTARAAVKGALAVPAMIGDALFSAGNLVQRAFGASDENLQPPGRSSRALDQLLNTVLPEPNTPTERFAGRVGEAMTGTGALAAAGKLARPVSDLGRSVATALFSNMPAQTASAASGGAAGAAAAEAGMPWWAQTMASFGGGAVAPGFKQFNPPQPQIRPNSNTAAFNTAGTTPSAAQATGSNFWAGMENVLNRFPGGQGVMKAFRDKQQEEMGATTATGVSAEDAGRVIEKGIKGPGGFLSRTSDQWKTLDDKLSSQVGEDTSVQPTNTIRTLDKLTERVEEPSINRILTNPNIVRLRNAVTKGAKATPDKTEFLSDFSMPVTTTGKPGLLPFKTLRQMRSEIGRQLDDSAIAGDFKNAELKALYGALSDDIREAAQRSGDSSLNTWNQQNRLWRGRQERVEGVLTRIVGDNKDPEKIFRSLAPSDPDAVTTLRTTLKSLLPEERQVVTDAIVARLGRATPGRQDDIGSVFSSETFLSNYNRMSPKAREVLFPNLTQRSTIEAVAKASSIIRDESKVFANASGTSGALAPYALGGMALNGPGGMTTAGALILGSRIGAKMLTNPQVAAWLAQGTKIPQGKLASHMARLATIYTNSNDDGLKAELADYASSLAQ